MKPTYDAVQMAAVLTKCRICRRSYYLTHPRFGLCIQCQQAKVKESRSDASRL